MDSCSVAIATNLVAGNNMMKDLETAIPDGSKSQNHRHDDQTVSPDLSAAIRNGNSVGDCDQRIEADPNLSNGQTKAKKEDDDYSKSGNNNNNNNNDGNGDSPPAADSLSEIGLGDDEDENLISIPRRNSESEALMNGGRLSRCTMETQSIKSDSDIDLSSDENCTSRQLQLKLLNLERQFTEQATMLAEEKERRICDLAHFQKERNDMLVKHEQLVKELERMKKDKEAAVMKYAKSEHEAITATRARDSLDKRLIEMTKERDVYVARVRQLNQDYTRMQSRLEARAGDLNKLERVIDRLTEEKARALQRFQDLEKYCDKLLADQQHEFVKTATEQTKELNDQLEETKRRLVECQKERDELYQRVNHLEDANRAHHEHLSLSQIEIDR